jgi:hypothetical protein
LLAIPIFAFVPKCPMCLLAYLALAEAAIWSHSGVFLAEVTMVVVSVIWLTWRILRRRSKKGDQCSTN